MNAQGYLNKRDQIRHFINTENPSLISLVEAHVTDRASLSLK